MRLAGLSDVHGNSAALDAVLIDLDRRQVDRVINLGDCLSGPLDASGTVKRLMALGWPTVCGNHDRQLYDRPKSEMGPWEAWVIDSLSKDELDWVKSFPKTISEGSTLFCHATPKSDEENWLDFRGPQHRLIARDLPGVTSRLGDTSANLICCGHTHTPRVVKIPGGPMIVNSGAVGVPAYLDTRMEPNFVHQTGAPFARYAIIEIVDGEWRADLVNVPYDPSDMIKLAEAKGAIHWARALASGWIA